MASSFEHVWSERGVEALVLSPLGGLYALGWWVYQAVYALGAKKPFEPHVPVVTVGNLVAGGSGKTPTALFVATVLERIGHKVVLSTSGYGFPRSHSASLAPRGALRASEWGDEAAMVRDARPELDLVVGRDRVEAARIAHREFPDAVLLMDDGFQHLRLRQHLTIVLDPELLNTFCLPAGPYREPRSTGVRRADLVVPSSRFALARGPARVKGGDALPKGGTVDVLCAIARPERLLSDLQGQGFALGTVRFLPDHDTLSAGTLLREFDPETPLVVTAKDWVKLRERGDLEGRTVLVADYEVSIEPQGAFEDWLRTKLDGLTRKTAS